MKNILAFFFLFIIFSPSFVLSMAQEEREDKPILHIATRLVEESLLISRENFTTTPQLHKGQIHFFLRPERPESRLLEEITFNLDTVRTIVIEKISSDPFSFLPLNLPCLFIEKESRSETTLDIPFHTISSVTPEETFDKDLTLKIQVLGGFIPGTEPILTLEFSLLLSFSSKGIPSSHPISQFHLKSYHPFPQQEIGLLSKVSFTPSKNQLSDPLLVFFDAESGFLFRDPSHVPLSYSGKKPLLSKFFLKEMVSFGEALKPSPRFSGYYTLLFSDPSSPSFYILKYDTNFFVVSENYSSLGLLEDSETVFLTKLLSPDHFTTIPLKNPFLLMLGNGFYEFELSKPI